MNKETARDYLPLVQALADGRVIQHSATGASPWWDDAEDLDFTDSPCNYRIRPEPREIWVNVYPNEISCGMYLSKEEAIQRRANDTAKQVCFREVFE